jgi:hypothetical protein
MTTLMTQEQELSSAWDSYLNQICSNVRQLDLLLNDFAIAASMIADEVNREDLLKIVAVQRFNPELYEAIYAHSDFVTYSQSWIKNPIYIAEDIRKRREEEALRAFTQILDKSSPAEAYHALITSLFPILKIKLHENQSTRKVERDFRPEISRAKKERRISHPDYFPAYFRYQVPDSIVGSKEFSRMLSDFGDAKTDDHVYALLSNLLEQFSIGSLKRYDLLERLSEENIGEETSVRISRALSRSADKFQYDMMDIGEASLALDFVFSAVKRISSNFGVRLLSEAVACATDDTFALRIVERITPRPDGAPADISLESFEQEDVKKTFRSRMVRRYGQKNSPQTVSIQTIDPRAFWFWAGLGPQDTALAHRFWRRYISQDKVRLAEALTIFFLRFGWSSNPASNVNMIFSDRYLAHGLSRFRKPKGPTPSVYHDALRWVEDYLEGEFVQGVSPFWKDRRHERNVNEAN